jgi:beta-lactamase regulating signal transducer with metallopeptidase domain
MDHGSNLEKGSPPPIRQTIRNFLIEMLVYGVLLVGYFFIVLWFLEEPLKNLFNQSLPFYAIVGLGLIVIQAVLLEFITSWLFDFLGLHRLTSK